MLFPIPLLITAFVVTVIIIAAIIIAALYVKKVALQQLLLDTEELLKLREDYSLLQKRYAANIEANLEHAANIKANRQ